MSPRCRLHGARAILISWLLLAGLSAVHTRALAQPAAVSGAYACVDAQGRNLVSDRPIPECLDREQRVLGPSGAVRERIGPTLTADEREAQEEARKREEEALRQALEDRRRDRALLIRYPTPSAHDRERAAALATPEALVAASNRRAAQLHEEMRKLKLEIEFYQNDLAKSPPALQRQYDNIVQGLAIQQRYIDIQNLEMQRINARFDEELRRLRPLWGGSAGR